MLVRLLSGGARRATCFSHNGRSAGVCSGRRLFTTDNAKVFTSPANFDDNEDKDQGEEHNASPLLETKTDEKLRDLFAEECMSFVRYQMYAKRADLEGLFGVADMFRGLARSELAQAEDLMDFYEQETGQDISTGQSIGNTEMNTLASVEKETYDVETLYPDVIETAKEDGFDHIAQMLEGYMLAEERQKSVVSVTYDEALKDTEEGGHPTAEEDKKEPNSQAADQYPARYRKLRE